MGLSADEPRMARARAWILAHGGVVECNTFTKMYLCALGQYDYDAVPAVPPEIVLFPNWFYFNLYEISAWSRSILVPLAIIYAKKPFKKLLPEQGIDELFVGGRANAILRLRVNKRKLISWRNFFICVDRVMHLAEAVHIRPLRTLALKRAEKWMLERLEMTDGLGAIYPAMLNAIIALRCLGYSEDDPQVIRARDEFEKLGIEQPATPEMPEPTFRMQPCVSPVWDTAQAVYALGEAGVSRTDPRMLKAADWMLSKEVRHKGDWAVKVPNVEPGGWYFEFNNEFYPDTDDTAQVLLALNKVDNPRERYQLSVAQRAIDWEFAMQCRNGGWGSFDKDNTKMIFQYIPFADHNAMLDPPTVDITGRMLEMLAAYGYTRDDKRVQKAIQFILKEQEPDGSWFGRWGVNYIYGTFSCCAALRPSASISTSRRCSRPPSGFAWCRIPTAAGARAAVPTTIPTPAASVSARPRRLPGPCSACSPPAMTAPTLSPKASAGSSSANCRTAVGTSPWARVRSARASSPAPVFPRSSISRTPCTASISRSSPSPATSEPWSVPHSFESNA